MVAMVFRSLKLSKIGAQLNSYLYRRSPEAT
jgi:hypothetical protein